MYHECDATEGHRVPSTYRRSARQFSGLGLNIDGTVWYRLMYIHRASRSPQSNQRERYLSLVLRQEKRKPPPSYAPVDSGPMAASMTKDEEGSLITTSDAARIVEFSYLLRFSLYRAKSPFFPSQPILLRLWWTVSLGEAFIPRYNVLGESISVARIDVSLFTLAITSNYLEEQNGFEDASRIRDERFTMAKKSRVKTENTSV